MQKRALVASDRAIFKPISSGGGGEGGDGRGRGDIPLNRAIQSQTQFFYSAHFASKRNSTNTRPVFLRHQTAKEKTIIFLEKANKSCSQLSSFRPQSKFHPSKSNCFALKSAKKKDPHSCYKTVIRLVHFVPKLNFTRTRLAFLRLELAKKRPSFL